MHTFLIQNITITDVELGDLGITVFAGGTYELLDIGYHDIARSQDLVTAIDNATIVFLDSDGVTPLDTAASSGVLSRKFNSNSVAPIAATESAMWGKIGGDITIQVDIDTALNARSLTSHLHTGTYENSFLKNTAFNKDFGTVIGTVAEGNQPGIVISQHETTFNHVGYTSHLLNVSNPHNTDKAQVGLSNVDNTSDLSKPISSATQLALDAKADIGSGGGGSPIKAVYRTSGNGSQTLSRHAQSIRIMNEVYAHPIYTTSYTSYSDDIIIGEDGWYKITYNVTVYSPKHTSNLLVFINVDNSLVSYSMAYSSYIKKRTKETVSNTIVVQLSSGQSVKLMASEVKGELITTYKGSNISIEQIESV